MTTPAFPTFRYCPVCGSAHFEPHDFKSRRCRDCGFIFYQNASASVVGVSVNEQQEILVGRRAFEPARGTLDLPGGFVDAGETLEEAVMRELKEETPEPPHIESPCGNEVCAYRGKVHCDITKCTSYIKPKHDGEH